jgi:hypothetical protein
MNRPCRFLAASVRALPLFANRPNNNVQLRAGHFYFPRSIMGGSNTLAPHFNQFAKNKHSFASMRAPRPGGIR